ncbi:MAG: BadF/BadG/BcrA/BcrD ATPase family protein [Bacillota bacterium]
MNGYVLGVDGGQTATKAALADLTGRVVARVTAGAWDSMGTEAGRERCRAAITGVLDSLLPAIPPGGRLVSACLGLTGGRTRVEFLEGWLRERVQPEHLQVVGDIVTNLRGADPSGGPGVVVIAGGGSAAWGHDGQGRSVLAGGHGYLLDDEGSGYELGRQAMIAVLKAHQGRRPPTALTPVLLQHFGASDPWEMRMTLYNGRAGRPEVAALVPLIAETARAGDPTALAILEQGARGLAEIAASVVRQLGLIDPPVFPTGGVFRVGDLLLKPFTAALAEMAPGARVEQPALPPLAGALVMALEIAGALTPEAVANLAAAFHEGAS